MTGIYKITNKVNGKVYIGKSEVSIESRRNYHFKSLREGWHLNRHLLNSVNKYGLDNFDFEVIEECDPDICSERERYWISYYKADNTLYGYNQTPGGDGSKKNYKSCYMNKDGKQVLVKEDDVYLYLDNGYDFGPLNPDKYANNRGKVCVTNGELNKYIDEDEVDEYIKNGYRCGQTVYNPSEYHSYIKDKKMINNGTERIYVPENDIQQYLDIGYEVGSNIHRFGDENSMFGKHHSEETKSKISESVKGFHHTEEAISRISNSLIGNKRRLGTHQSEEFKDMISKRMTGDRHPAYGKEGYNKGKIRINNGILNKLIYPNEFEEYESNGWKRGFIKLK